MRDIRKGQAGEGIESDIGGADCYVLGGLPDAFWPVGIKGRDQLVACAIGAVDADLECRGVGLACVGSPPEGNMCPICCGEAGDK